MQARKDRLVKYLEGMEKTYTDKHYIRKALNISSPHLEDIRNLKKDISKCPDDKLDDLLQQKRTYLFEKACTHFKLDSKSQNQDEIIQRYITEVLNKNLKDHEFDRQLAILLQKNDLIDRDIHILKSKGYDDEAKRFTGSVSGVTPEATKEMENKLSQLNISVTTYLQGRTGIRYHADFDPSVKNALINIINDIFELILKPGMHEVAKNILSKYDESILLNAQKLLKGNKDIAFKVDSLIKTQNEGIQEKKEEQKDRPRPGK